MNDLFDIYSPEIPGGYYEVFSGKIKKGDFLLFDYCVNGLWIKKWEGANGVVGSEISDYRSIKKVCRPLPVVKDDGTIDIPDGFSIVASGKSQKGDFYLSVDKWAECKEDEIPNHWVSVLIRRTKKER